MDRFIISCIQQIGVGTEDFRKSWNWYIDMFGIDVKILEDDTVAERMLPYTGGEPQQRHACIAVNLQGGGGFEIWQYSKRKAVPCPFAISVGDLGIFAAKLKCRDVAAFHKQLSERWNGCTAPEKLPDGTPCFYVKDLYGNIFQMVEDRSVFIEQHKLTGRMAGALGILDQIAALKKKYQFRIMIDDAHGFGAMGEHGRGTSEHFGVMDEIDIYIGAYAKSMAIIGGFVAADKDIKERLDRGEFDKEMPNMALIK